MNARYTSAIRGLSPEEAASYWFVQIDRAPLTGRERKQFEAWISESEAHAEAFARIECAFGIYENGDHDPHLAALRESALAVAPEPRRGLWLGLGAGIAASLVLVTLVSFGMPFDRASQRSVNAVPAASASASEAARPETGEFATARGERRTIELADGSTITLNTDSTVRVQYSPERRLVRLLRGQALFTVAKNPARPFVVRAADRQVTALGTVFEVRLEADRMKVMLAEGKVVVDGIADAPLKSGTVIVPTVLAPGQELVATIGSSHRLASVDVEQQLRWREGFVEFNDTTLSTAVREMNRYSNRELIIADAATGELPVSGVFRTGNPERFAAIVGELLPVRYRAVSSGKIELLPAASGAASEGK